jgi:hypothetical protein
MMAGSIGVPPAWARVVRMQTVVSLTDRSDPAVKQALKEAFDMSLRGATVATDEDGENEGPDNARDQ